FGPQVDALCARARRGGVFDPARHRAGAAPRDLSPEDALAWADRPAGSPQSAARGAPALLGNAAEIPLRSIQQRVSAASLLGALRRSALSCQGVMQEGWAWPL